MPQPRTIDRDWFFKKLETGNKSVRGLARHLDIHPSAVSRMLSGERRMKMEEANDIALFLGVPVKEVLGHIGVAIDLDGQHTRILLTSSIDQDGNLHRLDPMPLPQPVIERAQAAVGARNDRVLAAQVRASKPGPLSFMDDAVILFGHTDTVEPSAVGAMAVCRSKDGTHFLARIERARKTGEAICSWPSGKQGEVSLASASVVLAIIP